MRSNTILLFAALSLTGCPDADDREATGASTLLIRQDAEPAGANCEAGGTAVRAGLDGDGDGVLDDGEVLKTSYACGEAPGAVVTRTVAEPAGEACGLGGTRIEAGHDVSGDGVLQDDEVATTAYACVPADVAFLTRVVQEAPGVDCPLGGDEVRAGPDQDGDGELSAAEVAVVTHACRDAALGGFVVEDEADAALLQQVAVVKGDVIVESPTLTGITIPTDRILGSIVVRNCAALQYIRLVDSASEWSPAVVTGSVVVIDNGSPATLLFPCFTSSGYACASRIGGDLVVARNGGLTGSFDLLGGLGDVVGSISIESNPLLETLRLTDLVRIGGGLRIADNPSLESQVRVGAESIGGSIVLGDPWASVVFPNLVVAGGLTVRGTADGYVSLDELRLLGGSLSVEDNTKVLVVADRLDTIEGDVSFQRNGGWGWFGSFNRLQYVSGGVTFADNPELVSPRLPVLKFAWELRVERNAQLADLGGPDGTGLASFSGSMSLTLRNNPALAHLTLPSIGYVSSVTVEDSPLLPTCEVQAIAAGSRVVSGTDDLATCP